ncbi:MAG: hypothetical protein AABZ39_04945 [Spirochaetota bacterium]
MQDEENIYLSGDVNVATVSPYYDDLPIYLPKSSSAGVVCPASAQQEVQPTIEAEWCHKGRSYVRMSDFTYRSIPGGEDDSVKLSSFVACQTTHFKDINGGDSLMEYRIQLEGGKEILVLTTSSDIREIVNEILNAVMKEQGSDAYIDESLMRNGGALLHHLIRELKPATKKEELYTRDLGSGRNKNPSYYFTDGGISPDGSVIETAYKRIDSATDFEAYLEPYNVLQSRSSITAPLKAAVRFMFDCIIKSKRVMEAMLVLVYIFSSVIVNKLVSIGWQRPTIVVIGPPSSGKTTMERVLMGFMGLFRNSESFPSFSSTVNGIFDLLSKIRGLVVVIDNLRRENMSLHVFHGWIERLVGIADGAGRVRKNFGECDRIVSNVIINSESPINAGPAVDERIFEICLDPVEDEAIDGRKPSFLIQDADMTAYDSIHARNLPSAFIGFLKCTIGIAPSQVESEVRDIMSVFSARAPQIRDRTKRFISIIYYTFNRLATFLGEHVDYPELSAMRDLFFDYLLDYGVQYRSKTQAGTPVEIFINLIRGLISTHARDFGGADGIRRHGRTVEIISNNGFINDIFVIRLRAEKKVLINASALFQHRDFVPGRFPYTKAKITRELKGAGYLVEEGNDLPQFTIVTPQTIDDCPSKEATERKCSADMYVLSEHLFFAEETPPLTTGDSFKDEIKASIDAEKNKTNRSPGGNKLSS